MNTTKILDILPHTAAAPGPAPATPSRPEPRVVPAVGGGHTADLIEKRAEAQAQAHAATEERRRASAKPVYKPHFDREVGRVDDSFDVFIDLVNTATQDHRFRIFGPPEPSGAPAAPPGATADPASARAAYEAGTDQAPPAFKADI